MLTDTVMSRINGLIDQSLPLIVCDSSGYAVDDKQVTACRAWLVAAHNVISVLCHTQNPYLKHIERVVSDDRGVLINMSVEEIAQTLRNLLDDAKAGLVGSIENQAMGLAFDNFLDHAEEYLKREMKNEAGVLAGVVFEDAIRRIASNAQLEQRGAKVDNLISELVRLGILSEIKAKRARAAANVRTKASHAQWDEFDSRDVEATISFTQELISERLV